MARPLLKWAGGKRRIQKTLITLLPEKFELYYEPFFGGGALYFALQTDNRAQEAVISDLNTDLTNFYSVVRDTPDTLIQKLSNIEFKNTADHYYAARKYFNSISEDEDPVLKAALLIYLNRHCYNGLFRVNSKGEFNVPFGRYKNPGMPSVSSIKETSTALQSAIIFNADFEEALQSAGSGDLVYLDPPYDPLSATSSFTNYDRNGFSFVEQQRLAEFVQSLDRKGSYFILSNSSTEDIMELYSSFEITRVGVGRSINSRAERRGSVEEIIVTNY